MTICTARSLIQIRNTRHLELNNLSADHDHLVGLSPGDYAPKQLTDYSCSNPTFQSYSFFLLCSKKFLNKINRHKNGYIFRPKVNWNECEIVLTGSFELDQLLVIHIGAIVTPLQNCRIKLDC